MSPAGQDLTDVKSFPTSTRQNVPMRPRTNFIIDAVIMAAYLVSTNPMTTGTPVHEWLSIGVGIVALVHLVVHWEWTVNAVRRLLHRLGALSRINLVVDVGLLVSIVTVVMSGLLVSQSALHLLGYEAWATSIWHRVHSEASTVLLALVGLHVGLHWTWVTSVLRNQVLRPLFAKKSGQTRAPRRAAGRSMSPGAVATGTVCALALVGTIAGGVWFAAPVAEERLAWLVLPGASDAVHPAESSDGASVATTTAAHFGGTTLERVAVRTSHSLLLLVVAALAGSAVRESLKSG